MTERYVIIGAGLTGAKAVETLRAEGFVGEVTLIGAEAHRPYERPPLSKAVLAGKAEPESAYVHDPDWYTANNVDLRTGVRATAIDRDARVVALSDGGSVGYDKLLLATGSSPRQLDVPGNDLPGVLYLRTMEDSRLLATRLTGASQVVVIGGGWIGLEVAAAAREHGADVTVVEMTAMPLQRVLGVEVARRFLALHESHGVKFRLGVGIRALTGTARVAEVVLADDTALPADIVVVGVGIHPNDELAADAGLATPNGVAVSAGLVTADPRVYAAGDVAYADHPLLGRPIRVEHWANALNGGQAAARAMLGHDTTYDRVPYFFTDQFELGMEYAGYAEPGGYDQVVFRGTDDAYIAFWLSAGRVLAGMNVNVWDVQGDIQRLVRAGYTGATVDPTQLADVDVPLAEVLPTQP